MAVAAPTTAERVRSACARADGAMLAVEGTEPVPAPVHHLFEDGSFAVTVPADPALAGAISAAGAAGLPAVLELTDYAPLPLREPVRSLVWARGRIHGVADRDVRRRLDHIAAAHPNPALLEVNSTPTPGNGGHLLLRLESASVVVADTTGAESVAIGALLAAAPDPFWAMESCWLQHLEASHRDVVDRLAARLPAGLRRGRVRPLGLDRYGIVLRVETTDGDHDVRLPFGQPVDDATGLGRAIRLLMGCPFRNGLQARQL